MSILHVSELHLREYAKHAHNVACPDLGKTFKFKIRMSQKETSAQIFPQFLGILGQIIVLHVPKMDILVYKINVLLFLGHGAADIHFDASPQNGKTFIL